MPRPTDKQLNYWGKAKRQVTPKQRAAYERKMRLDDLRERLRQATDQAELQQKELNDSRDRWHEAIQEVRQLEGALTGAIADRDFCRDRFESDQAELAELLAKKNALEKELEAEEARKL